MEITGRKENPILNRVEITWQWRHVGSPTPTRKQIVDAVIKLEPGATIDRILVKSVNTRFGQPLTSGDAFIYNSRDDLEKEPKYIIERHNNLSDAAPEPEVVEAATNDESDSESVEIAGGEE